MKQNKISVRTRLLDSDGELTAAGYGVTDVFEYRRGDIKANPMRIKEWDFYQISDERYTIQMVLADISLGGAGTFTLFDRKTGERVEALNLSVLTAGRLGLPENANTPHFIRNKGNNFNMSIQVMPEKRVLLFDGKDSKGSCISAEITLDVAPGLEYLYMAVPFNEKKHFYLNQKMNCMPASGKILCRLGEIELDSKSSFCVLDWGRGVWPYKCDWYWGNGSTYLPDGKVFGFEIGWGFGNMTAFTENTLFYDYKAHKIGEVFLEKDASDYMKPWIFTSNDGRFMMTMTPEFDNFTSSRVLAVGNICHQVFGLWNGYAVLDNGTVIEVNDMTAFCEHSDNRW